MQLLKHEIIKKKIIDDIAMGKYGIGDMLPSVRKLAEAHNMSVGSVNRATLELVQEGILKTATHRHGILVNKKTKLSDKRIAAIALVYESIEYHPETKFLASMILSDVISEEAAKKKIACSVYTHQPVTMGEDKELIEDLSKHRIIIFFGTAYLQWAKYLELKGCFVLYFTYREPLGCNWIFYDYKSGLKFVMEKLIKQGHRKIGLICSSLAFSYNKFTTYRDTLSENNLELDMSLISIEEKRTSLAGYKACLSILKNTAHDKYPSAIIVDTDYRAAGAIDAIRDTGLKVPETISVIAIDRWERETPSDISKITSFGIDHDTFSERVLNIIKGILNGKDEGLIQEYTSFKFYPGETVTNNNKKKKN